MTRSARPSSKASSASKRAAARRAKVHNPTQPPAPPPEPDSDADWQQAVTAQAAAALAPEVLPAEGAAPAPYVPTIPQVRYLLAVREAAESGKPTTDVSICAGMHLSRRTLWEWRKDLRFCAWVVQEVLAPSEMHWALTIARHEQLAIRGSVRSAEFLLKTRVLGGKLGGGGQGGDGEGPDGLLVDASKHYTVNILVPRPPEIGAEGG